MTKLRISAKTLGELALPNFGRAWGCVFIFGVYRELRSLTAQSRIALDLGVRGLRLHSLVTRERMPQSFTD